ncbi:MAG: FecR domain-containing protein [Sinobacteraceae bacterium]|nr:FecR domain-containing protein [Nevskiaceae bacterium]
MRRDDDDLSVALEGLRNRPIVTESREYAHQWARARARAASVRVSVGAVAALCVTAYILLGLPGAPSSLLSRGLFAKNVIETDIQNTRAVTLEDGSRIMLDRNSRLRIAFAAGGRDVELLEGQAHFEVAKDPHRPFRVRTASAEVIAVGTMFDVANLPTQTRVTLIEGRVNVRTLSNLPQATPQVEALVPGQELDIASDGQFLNKRVVKIENVTAWQRNTIVLDDMPLPEALAAMNRYALTQIVITDPTLQSRRLSGVFRIGDVETETLVLERYFNLREASRSGHAVILERMKY